MARLQDKVAIVTGGATGIGEAISKKFAEEGAKVVVAGLPSDPVQEVVEEIRETGGPATPYLGDLGVEDNARACVEAAVHTYGRLDVLISNAGVFLETAETQDYDTDVFDRTFVNNCRATFLMVKHALPRLRKTRGNIVAAGSESGLLGLPNNTPYGGTKGFIHAFIRGVAVEQAKYGIRANCVCPGPIDTAWTRRGKGPMNRKMEKMLIQAVPLGRRGTPEEIANVYAFLASDEASYVTGALWYADGGTTIAKGPAGAEAHRSVTQPPAGELDLQHSHEGLENKRVRQKV